MKQILIRPVITEKYQRMGEEKPNRSKQYAFVVALDANKIEIKKAIESQYQVSVESCRTYIQRTNRVTRFTKKRVIEGQQGRSKRAVVTLAAGNEIDFYVNV